MKRLRAPPEADGPLGTRESPERRMGKRNFRNLGPLYVILLSFPRITHHDTLKAQFQKVHAVFPTRSIRHRAPGVRSDPDQRDCPVELSREQLFELFGKCVHGMADELFHSHEQWKQHFYSGR